MNELITVGTTKADLIITDDGRLQIVGRRSEEALVDVALEGTDASVERHGSLVVLVVDKQRFAMRALLRSNDDLAKTLAGEIRRYQAPPVPAATDDAVDPRPATSPLPAFERTCSGCDTQVNDPEARYCPQCGQALDDLTVSDVMTHVRALAGQVAALSRKVETLDSTPAGKWKWSAVPNNERWAVWWGVVWRGLLISLGFWLIAALLIVAAGS